MRKLIRRATATLMIISSLLVTAIVGAAIQMFDGQGKYIMSDFENHDIAKQRAIQRAEKDAQKKAGIYLTQFSKSVNSELTTDEISAVTNNIIKVSDVNVKPVPFEANGEAGLMYEVTLKATIDTDGIYDFLKRDSDKKVTIIQQNNSLQDAIVKNDKLAEDLKAQYNRAKSQADKDKIRKQMSDAERDFLVNQKLEAGNKLAYAGDYNGAIKIYNEVIQLKPNSDAAYNNRGNAYHGLKQNERALADYNKALQLAPNDSESYYNRAGLYKDLEQYDRAIQDYNKAIQLAPNDSDSYNNRGIVYFHLEQYNKAIADFNKSIQLDPKDSYPYNNRGVTYAKLKQYEQAIRDFDRSIQLNPNLASPYNNRGSAYEDIEQYERAIQDYSKAIQLNPNDAQTYNGRGRTYGKLKQTDRAIQDFDRAI